MSTYNSVVILGVIPHAVKLKHSPTGVPKVEFDVLTACSASKDEARIHVEAHRRLAELCASFLKKGRKALIVGELRQDQKSLTIVAREVKFLGNKEAKTDGV